MRLFELTIDNEDTDEVFQISLVENPAIEAFGVFFDKEEVQFAETEEEGLFITPILVPDKKILRVDGQGVPYEVYFTAPTIKRLAQMYLEKKYQGNVNIEHSKKVNGVTLVESWIKESHNMDKSKMYNLNVPVGSWIGTFKIDNEKVREQLRSGKLRAVSIEGLFEHAERTTPERMQSAMLMESFAEFDWLSEKFSELGGVNLAKEVDDLTEDEAKKLLNTIHKLLMPEVQLESYSDYPDGVKNNAKKAVEWAEKNGWGSCGTPVGKTRASQLSNGEPISIETIKRMYSYLSRHEGDLDSSSSFGEGCGYLMYQAWGGKAALGWSRNKLRELGQLEENEQPTIDSSYPGEASGSISPATL